MPALSIELFDKLLKEALIGLFDTDLCKCDWYIREHEVVNVFVFGHLVPLFQQHGLDLTSIGIEFPVLQVEMSSQSKHGARKDLVIWPSGRTTLWKGCALTAGVDLKGLHAISSKPLAIVEWKNISRIMRQPKPRSAEHQKDIAWLKANVEGGMMQVGYAVLIDQTRPRPLLTCRRVTSGSVSEFLTLPVASAAKQ